MTNRYLASDKNTPHGNTGRRNAAKAVRKSGRICFRCFPHVEQQARQLAEIRGVSLSELLSGLIESEAFIKIRGSFDHIPDAGEKVVPLKTAQSQENT